jgi:hypothetical protein
VVNALDETSGMSSKITGAMQWLADNMEKVVGVAATLATVLGVTLARYALEIVIGRLATFIGGMTVAPVMAFAGAITTLSVAVVRTSASFTMGIASAAAYSAAMGVTALGGVLRFVAGVGGAVTALRGLSMAAIASSLSFASIGAAMAGAVALLMSPIRMVIAAVGVLATTFTVVLTGALRVASGAMVAFGAVASTAMRMAFGIVGVVAAIGVAMYTLGENTKIAQGSTVTYRDVAVAAWEGIKVGFGKLTDFMGQMFPKISKWAEDSFGDSGSAFLKYGKIIAYGLDYMVSAFKAAYTTIVDNWNDLPTVLLNAVIQAVKWIWNKLFEFLTAAYNLIRDFMKKVMAGAVSEMLNGTLEERANLAAAKMASSYSESFKKEMESNTAFREGFENWMKLSQQMADERIKKAEEATAAEKRAREELAKGGVDKTVDPEAKKKPKGFEDYLKELEREKELGLAIGDAYKIINAQIDIANKLRTPLTALQKEQVAAIVAETAALERKRTLLQEIKGNEMDYGQNVTALTELYKLGSITLDEYNAKFKTLRENFLNGLPEATTFADGFAIQMEKMKLATQNGMGAIGTEVAKIFGPGGSLINGIGDAIAQSIVFGKSFKEQIKSIAQNIVSQLISSLIKMALNMAMNGAMAMTQMGATTAAGVASAGALTAAYLPAAGLSSIATGGANAAGAASGITSVFTMLASLVGGFAKGGYTGNMGAQDIAGVVHGQEFVINAKATSRHRKLLEAINRGQDPMSPIIQTASMAPAALNVAIRNEIPEAAYEVRQLSETDVEIIAKRVVRRETPDVVAQDLRNSNSRTSRSLRDNTTSMRKR